MAAKAKVLAGAKAEALKEAKAIHLEAIHAQKVAHPTPYYPPAKFLINGPVVPKVVPAFVPEPAKTAAFLNTLEARWAANPARFDANHPTIGPMIGFAQVAAPADDPVRASSTPRLWPRPSKCCFQTPYYQYFEARRSIDPTRFDTYHPNLSAIIAENQVLHDLVPSAQNLIPKPPGPPIPASGGGGTGSPATVPEPGPLVLGTLAVAAMLLALRWMRAGWLACARAPASPIPAERDPGKPWTTESPRDRIAIRVGPC